MSFLILKIQNIEEENVILKGLSHVLYFYFERSVFLYTLYATDSLNAVASWMSVGKLMENCWYGFSRTRDWLKMGKHQNVSANNFQSLEDLYTKEQRTRKFCAYRCEPPFLRSITTGGVMEVNLFLHKWWKYLYKWHSSAKVRLWTKDGNLGLRTGFLVSRIVFSEYSRES